MKKTAVLLGLLFSVSFAYPGATSYDENPTPCVINMADENFAKEIITAIVDAVGLKQNFEVERGDVKNALAKIKDRKRYVYYNTDFITRIKNGAKTDWVAISILAHEVGHHLNGHTLSAAGANRLSQELEADEFSGFVLRKMGASLKDAQAAMYQLNNRKPSKTHPCRVDRLDAIETGWKKAHQQERTRRKNWVFGKSPNIFAE